jgi:hypothetical protein
MITEQNISIVIQIATLLGIVFGVYAYFRKPQEKGELTDAVFAQRFTQFDRDLANLRDNHIHTISEKLDKHIDSQSTNDREVAGKLGGLDAKIDILLKR